MKKSISMSDLERDARDIRKTLLKMHFEANSGHIGSSLSSIEILSYVYRVWLKENDRFILSKGHGASGLYAVLNHVGLISDQDLSTYYQNGTRLPAHPAPNAWRAIPAATGSLGHGLPIASGLAFANQKLLSSEGRVACLISDGECNSGATWEAVLFAAHHQLRNLIVIVDANGLQGFGKTTDVLNTEPLREKWESFGFHVSEVEGHNFSALDAAFRSDSLKPKCLIARTVKGKGVSFMENKMEWHYLTLKPEEYAQAIGELDSYES